MVYDAICYMYEMGQAMYKSLTHSTSNVIIRVAEMSGGKEISRDCFICDMLAERGLLCVTLILHQNTSFESSVIHLHFNLHLGIDPLVQDVLEPEESRRLYHFGLNEVVLDGLQLLPGQNVG